MPRKTLKKSIDVRAGVKQYPPDFRELFDLISSNIEIANIRGTVEQIQKNKFYIWLNKEGSEFTKAKNRIINKRIIPAGDFLPQTASELLSKYELEYICILCVHYFIDNEDVLKQVPVLKKGRDEIKTAMKFIKSYSETRGTLPFENGIVYQIFQKSLEILLNNEKTECCLIKISTDPKLTSFDEMNELLQGLDGCIKYEEKTFYFDIKKGITVPLNSKSKKFRALVSIINDLEVNQARVADDAEVEIIISVLGGTYKRSLYSTSKSHPELARELMTKRTLEVLYRRIGLKHKLKVNFISTIALEITNQFFDTRMATDIRILSREVKANVIEQNKLWNMPINEFLMT